MPSYHCIRQAHDTRAGDLTLWIHRKRGGKKDDKNNIWYKALRSAGGIRRPLRLLRKDSVKRTKRRSTLDCKCKLAT